MSSNRSVFFRTGTYGLSARGFFYAGIPIIILDETGRVAEVNAACRELMGTDIAGCKGYSYTYLTEQIGAKVKGNLFASRGPVSMSLSHPKRSTQNLILDDLDVSVSECQYRSPRFGIAKLLTSELPCVDIVSGQYIASIANVEILALEEQGLFQASLKRRWTHEVMWEVYAASYDRILLELPFYQEVMNRHCAAMSSEEIKSVLDVGAGTGNVTVRLLKQGKNVTAVDVGRAMLEKLYTKLDEVPTEKLRIIEDTAERLPHLEDQSFDGVTVLLAFFDMQDPLAALREAERVLKPGGTLIITDPKKLFDVDQLMAAAERILRSKGIFDVLAEDWKRIRSVAPMVNETIQEIQSYEIRLGSRLSWHAEAIFELLRDHGFTDLSMEDSHFGNCATIKGIKRTLSS